jgi:hypothetical protein
MTCERVREMEGMTSGAERIGKEEDAVEADTDEEMEDELGAEHTEEPYGISIEDGSVISTLASAA